jgi:hypothetical protein
MAAKRVGRGIRRTTGCAGCASSHARRFTRRVIARHAPLGSNEGGEATPDERRWCRRRCRVFGQHRHRPRHRYRGSTPGRSTDHA